MFDVANLSTAQPVRPRHYYSLNQLRRLMYRYFRRRGVQQWQFDYDSNTHEFLLGNQHVVHYRVPAGAWKPSQLNGW